MCAVLGALRGVLPWAVLCKEDRAPSEGRCASPVPREALGEGRSRWRLPWN